MRPSGGHFAATCTVFPKGLDDSFGYADLVAGKWASWMSLCSTDTLEQGRS
jgi:hypothetical protein